VSTRAITPVVAAPVPLITHASGEILQRACDYGQHTIGGAELMAFVSFSRKDYGGTHE